MDFKEIFMTKFKDLIFPSDRSKSLNDFDTYYTIEYNSKKEARLVLEEGIQKLTDIQDKLYAYDKYALLIIFQAMDAAGKDGTIKHVMSGVNPQGCQVTSFRSPSEEELDQSYLWRCIKALPRRGNIGIFNRSYYEELLIVRVHPKILKKQRLPGITGKQAFDSKIWNERFEEVNNFEKYLNSNGTMILKFFLHVSKEEQKRRFIKRINDPRKNWKISMSDYRERKYWDEYMQAYEDMLLNTSTPDVPWFVIPADNKWFMRATVSEIIVKKLESLSLHYPELTEKKLKEIRNTKELLEKEE